IESRAQRFSNYRDQLNSQRIYKAVIRSKKKNKFKNKLKYDILSQHLFKRFRKYKNYYKIMDKYNTFVSKVIPVKKDLLVFESNVGKAVSDSPKVIYDAL